MIQTVVPELNATMGSPCIPVLPKFQKQPDILLPWQGYLRTNTTQYYLILLY